MSSQIFKVATLGQIVSPMSVRTALKAIKAGDLAPMQEIVKGLLEKDVANITRLNSYEPTDKLPFDTAKTNQTPVLKLHLSSAFMNAMDFTRLITPELRNQLEIRQVIKGRYMPNLQPDGDYYLFFNNFQDASKYWNLTNKEARRLNGNYASFEFVPDISRHFAHLYTPFLPDLQGLPELIKLARKQDSSKLIDVLTQRYMETIKNQPSTILQALNESVLLQKYADNDLKLGHDRPSRTISRSHCVIFRNVPENISQDTIRDFLWNLKWYEVEELNLRRIFVNPTTKLATYVMVFQTSKDAQRCVQICDNQPLFYNTKLPTVEAELLDEKP